MAQGLGFPQLSNMRTLPVFFNMMTQGLIDAPTFSIYLNPDPAAEPAGEVQFGGMNTARYIGEVAWTPVVEKSCVPSSPSMQGWNALQLCTTASHTVCGRLLCNFSLPDRVSRKHQSCGPHCCLYLSVRGTCCGKAETARHCHCITRVLDSDWHPRWPTAFP